MTRARAFPWWCLLLLSHACGGAEVGESCDDVGSADECVSGAVCTNEDDDALVCRMECDEQEDCPDDHDCNGVSNSNRKTCQPKA